MREVKTTLMNELPKVWVRLPKMGNAVLYCEYLSVHQMSWYIFAYPCRDMSPGRKLAILA